MRPLLMILILCPMLASASEAGVTCGWRDDGTGCKPEFRWSGPVDGEQAPVVWRTVLPDRTTASPIVADGRVFTMVEPHWLYCLDEGSGEVLWKRSFDVLDELPSDQAAKAKEQFLKAWEGTNAFRTHDKNEDKQKHKELKRAVQQLWKPLEPHGLYMTEWIENGFTSATPVTDGEHIWVKLGTGVVACVDLDGELRWRTRWPAYVRDQEMCIQSPLLVDGKLIFTWNPPQELTGEPEHCREALMALDPATGKVLWQSEEHVRTPGWLCATPVVMHLGGEPVVITAGGGVYAASDGKLLAKKVIFAGSACSPVVRGDTVYALDMESHTMKKKPEDRNAKGSRFYAVRLRRSGAGVEAEELWRTDLKPHRNYPSPIVDDKHVYLWNTNRVIRVMDAATGAILSERRIEGRGWNYCSPALGGDLLFLPNSDGQLSLAEADPDGAILTTWNFHPFSSPGWLGEASTSTPLLHDGRAFWRTGKALYCLGGASAR